MEDIMLALGAEATIVVQGDRVLKRRLKKGYRIDILDDALRRRRTRSEQKMLKKAGQFVVCPQVFPSQDLYTITMTYLRGQKLSEMLDTYPLAQRLRIMVLLGQSVALLHGEHIIHGDLTTSNLLLEDGAIAFVDFGLGFISTKVESKAVDLHVLKEALRARHFSHFVALFDAFLEGYSESQEKDTVLERLRAVERRGRYRH